MVLKGREGEKLHGKHHVQGFPLIYILIPDSVLLFHYYPGVLQFTEFFIQDKYSTEPWPSVPFITIIL